MSAAGQLRVKSNSAGRHRSAIVALVSVFALLAFTASADAAVVYDNIETPQPGNVISEAFEATSTSEWGGQVELAGSARKDPKVSVLMSSWGCESGGGASCETTPGSTFAVPITLRIYAVEADDSPGAILATKTKTFEIPFRPSADLVNCTGGNEGKWFDAGSSTCFNGFATPISFNLAGSGVTLPSKLIATIAFNTSHHGYSPLGELACFSESGGCGYDSLNVGAETVPPTVGAIPASVTDDIYQATTFGGFYCDGGAGGTGVLRRDDCTSANGWADYQPSFRIAAFEDEGFVVNDDTAGSGPAGANCAEANFETIQEAVDTVPAGSEVLVCEGTYDENVSVDKGVTIKGAGAGTVVRPSIHNPTCLEGGEGSLCAGGAPASVVFLVKASNVKISDLIVDGDNPALEGSEIDARDGIETATNAKYDGFEVDHVSVRNIYLRGIYAASGGSFAFDHNTVEHVSSDPASIAIFNFEGSGSMTDNVVSDANDAIASNWSRGVTMTGNTITDSGSGLHSDNAGGAAAGPPDVIADNSVSACKTDGYGVWVFVPYVAPNVHDNTVSGCAVGLGAFGGSFSGPTVTPVFSHNDVDGAGAPVSAGTTAGVWLDTTTFYYGDTDNNVQLTANTIRNFDEGLYLGEGGGADLVASGSFNRIVDNSAAINSAAGTVGNLENNWWGCNAGPGNPDCGTASGPADVDPWLVLKATANPTSIALGGNPTSPPT